jgi:hypothetical protein
MRYLWVLMRYLWVLLLWLPIVCRAQGADATAQTPGSIGTLEVRTPGSISGTVTDTSGALVPGATVLLSLDGEATGRKATTDSDGDFTFEAVPTGKFRLSVTATGMEPGSASGTLKPGEQEDLPTISLRVAMQDTDIEVSFTRDELGVAEVQAEEHQRLLGILPNFSVAYDWNAPPMTTRQKYHVAWRTMIDPVTIVLNAGIAGYQQAEDDIPGYHEGAEGYFKRFGADMTTSAVGTFLGGAILPEVFHQDPRYFWKGSGTVRQRFLYAVSAVFICRNDRNGHWMPNYSNVIGDFTAGAVANAYYPASSREGFSLTLENGAAALGFGAASNLFQEFLLHHFTPKLPRSTPAPPDSHVP